MSEIKIGRMVLGMCSTNTYFVYREDTKEAIVFDPADQGEQIYKALMENSIRIGAILLTHGHFDHIWGVDALRKLSGAKVYADEAEFELLQDAKKNISEQAGRACTVKANIGVKDGEILELCGMKLKVLSTPGHTPGGCCYYVEEAGFLLCGDTLFAESVGRTDFAGGSMSALVRSIQDKLFLLPEETKCYPGHGEATTIGHEMKYNPYLV